MKQKGYIIKTIDYDKIEKNVIQLIKEFKIDVINNTNIDNYIVRLLTYRGILKYLKLKNILKSNFEEYEEKIVNLLYDILKENNLRLVNTNSLIMEELPEIFCTKYPIIDKIKELYLESNKLLV